MSLNTGASHTQPLTVTHPCVGRECCTHTSCPRVPGSARPHTLYNTTHTRKVHQAKFPLSLLCVSSLPLQRPGRCLEVANGALGPAPNDRAVRGGHENIDRNIAQSHQRFALNEIECPLSREPERPPSLRRGHVAVNPPLNETKLKISYCTGCAHITLFIGIFDEVTPARATEAQLAARF